MQKPGITLRAMRRFALIASAALAVCAVAPGVADAKKPKKPKFVKPAAAYTETNADANQLLVMKRKADGTLRITAKVSTKGKGGHQDEPGCTPPGGCPLLDADSEVVATKNGKLVFAVNAGSNTIASFVVKSKGGVKPAKTKASGGVFPNSIAIHGNVLYVLNTNSANIAGFRFDKNGKLTPIAGSVQALTMQHAPLSRQIGFDNTGKYLVVTELTDGGFNTFPVKNGVAGPAAFQPSASPEPFGFAFDPVKNYLVDSEVVNDMVPTQSSNASVYALTATGYTPSTTGGLQALSTVPTQGFAACWVQISSDGKQVFIVNTSGGSPFGATVTSMSLSATGQLTFESKVTTPEFTIQDAWLSPDDKFLYVVSGLTGIPGVSANVGSNIITFGVGANGTLTRLGNTKAKLAPGLSGLTGS